MGDPQRARRQRLPAAHDQSGFSAAVSGSLARASATRQLCIMPDRFLRAAAAAAAVVCLTFVARASTPTFWQASTQADFLKGDVENVSVDSDGRLILGP